MRCIEEGRTYPLLYNDDVLVPAIMKEYGVGRARAESYVPLGCGEFEFDHYSFATPSGALNAVKILEIAMHGGWEPVGRRPFGPQTKGLKDCASFEEFYGVYKTHLDFYAEAQAKFEAYEYKKTGELHPFMFVSMLYDGCCESGKAIFDGGCRSYNGTLELYGVINAADSLVAIRELVFEKKLIGAERLLEILRLNFMGCERERKLMMDCPKYGNDDEIADAMAVGLQKYLCEKIIEQAPKAGLDSYFAVIINNAQNTTLARWAGASPDGRKAGTPYANANNPSMGADRNGLTAMINSLLKMPTDNNAGTVQNLRLTRELFQSSREKVHALIESYFDRGGAQFMITVVGKDDLARAMDDPAQYKDLIVRVGGFSARFVDLPKDVQKEIFERVTY
jgi:pyruvate-formate lyase